MLSTWGRLVTSTEGEPVVDFFFWGDAVFSPGMQVCAMWLQTQYEHFKAYVLSLFWKGFKVVGDYCVEIYCSMTGQQPDMVVRLKSLDNLPLWGGPSNYVSHYTWWLFLFMSLIMVWVIWVVSWLLLYFASRSKTFKPHKTSNHDLEYLWTKGPIYLLSAMALPSLWLTYEQMRNPNPVITTKVIGHQWYWEYELGIDPHDKLWKNQKDVFKKYLGKEELPAKKKFMLRGFSYPMVSTQDPTVMKRWESLDAHLVLPMSQPCRLSCTSADVVHNYNVKPLVISADCVPGRLNQVKYHSQSGGLWSGLCSELCGVFHPHMPTGVESYPWTFYESFILAHFKSKTPVVSPKIFDIIFSCVSTFFYDCPFSIYLDSKVYDIRCESQLENEESGVWSYSKELDMLLSSEDPVKVAKWIENHPSPRPGIPLKQLVFLFDEL